MTPSNAQLGCGVRRLREARRLTIETLAGDAGMHSTYLSTVERGLDTPTWEKRRERPGAGEPRQRFLTRDEITRLLKHAGDIHDHIATLLFTGLRVMEMLALWWEESDFVAEEVHARCQLSRSGKRVPLKTKAAKRDIVFMRALANTLRRRRLAQQLSGDQDFIFQGATTGRPMTYKTFLKHFHAACEDAGLVGVRHPTRCAIPSPPC